MKKIALFVSYNDVIIQTQNHIFSFGIILCKLCGEWPVSTSSFNLSPPNATYIPRWTESVLVQVIACRLLGANPLPEPMHTYCQLHPQEHTLVKLESKYKTFHSRKCIWKYRMRNGGHFVQGKWVKDCRFNTIIHNGSLGPFRLEMPSHQYTYAELIIHWVVSCLLKIAFWIL